MSIAINLSQSGAGFSFSPRVGIPTMRWIPQTAKIV